MVPAIIEYFEAADGRLCRPQTPRNKIVSALFDVIGTDGLLRPAMHAHLGRDPYPARLMQRHAVRTYRWVERMNRADQDAPEYFNAGNDFLVDDEVPETLLDVLKVIAEDFVPETVAAALMPISIGYMAQPAYPISDSNCSDMRHVIE